MKIGIVGFGNMGSAFAEGLKEKAEFITVYDIDEEKRKLAIDKGFGLASDLYFLVESSDVILVAVKPKDIKGVLEKIKENLGNRILVSVAAGVDIAFIEKITGEDKKIVRMMPNINVAVKRGTIAVAFNKNITDMERQAILDLFSSCGRMYEIPENMFDSFTAIAGSSPAFIMSFIDALALAGVKEGFDYNTALKIVLDTVEGTASLLKEKGGNPNEWITRVTSPSGTTIEGLSYLEREGFRGIVIKCIEKTSEKSKKLKG